VVWNPSGLGFYGEIGRSEACAARSQIPEGSPWGPPELAGAAIGPIPFRMPLS
jgi:hypothetical protein